MNISPVPRILWLLLVLATVSLPSMASDWPQRPISIVVPWPAGGVTDITARTIAPLLSAELGQPVIVVNRAGATGNIGAESVLQQPADGYNLFFGAASHLINSALYAHNKRPLRYDVVNDFTYAAVLTDSRMVLVVHPSVPADTLPQFVQWAKSKKPGEVMYSSSGTGSFQHLSMELLQRATGVQMLHVPYKGINPSITDLTAGVVQASVESLNAVLPLIKGGKLKALATMTEAPVGVLPGVQTAASQGYPGLWVAGPQFIGVSKNTPDAVVARISDAFAQVFRSPEVVKKLEAAGITVRHLPREQANVFVRSESLKWTTVIREANVQAE